MIVRLRLLILFQISLAAGLSAQTKYEREYPIKSDEVPAAARRQVSSLFPESQAHWYREESLDDVTVEAKIKRGKDRFSIEFDTSGRLQDIEVEISRADIPAAVWQQMNGELASTFTRFKMQRIQVQYAGEDVSALFQTQPFDPDRAPVSAYEVIGKGRTSSGPALYEITFLPDGAIAHTAEIVMKNTDNLEY